MADKTKVPATGKVPAPLNTDVLLENEKIYEYEKRVRTATANRGSRYPPFSIEPLPWERQRLATPMSAEDRFLRKQWLVDQHFSPGEPRFVPWAKPKNIFRTIYRYPWDLLEIKMANSIGGTSARVIRSCVPRLMLAGVVAVLGYYQIKYNSHDWSSISGVNVYGSKRTRFPGDDTSKFRPDPETFATKNFENRKVLLNYE